MERIVLAVNQSPKAFETSLKELPEHTTKGVYFLLYYQNGNPRSISRLCGVDSDGILYIGMTEGPLLKRVCNLQKAVYANSEKDITRPNAFGHPQMGQRFYRIRSRIALEDLFILIVPSDHPKELESNSLEDYVCKYGELPPLNGQYGSIDPDWSSIKG